MLSLIIAGTGAHGQGPPPAIHEETVNEQTDLNLDQANGSNLTLEESVRIAITAATSVLKSQNAAEVAGVNLLQSYAQFLPNLEAQASTTRNRGTEYLTVGPPSLVKGSTSSAGYSLSTTLNIFNGLSDLSRFKAASLRKDASDLNLFRAKQAIALDITQGFLTVILDNQLVKIARKNLQESQAREKLLFEQTQVGSRSLADLFRQKAQRSVDEALLFNTENQRRTDQILLLQKLRMDVTKSYHFVDYQYLVETANERFKDENKLIQLGLENRADLKATTNTAKAAHWDVKQQWGSYLPRLDLQAGLNSAGSYLYSQSVNGASVVPASQTGLYNQLGSQIEYSVGLVLTWGIFDRFVTRQAVAQARAQASDAEIDAEDSHNQVLADVRLAYSSYKTALQQLRASKEGLEAAQKAYEVIEGRYEVGSANFIDLVTAQASLLQAESTRAQALTNFTLQGKALEFAIGEIKAD
jgi:outer membrane protein